MGQIKNTLITVFSVFLFFFVFTKLFGPIPFSVNSINTNKPDLFRVEGTGEAKGTPNQATFSVGVTETAATIELAKAQANKTINAITQDLKEIGISDADIKTSNFNAYPNYAPQAVSSSGDTGGMEVYPGKKMMMPEPTVDKIDNNKIISYTVTENLDISVKQIKLANQAIDIAGKNNADIISGISFTFDEKEQKKLEEKARTEAVKKAKEKAQSLAKMAGVNLGKIADIQEYSSSPSFNGYSGGGGMDTRYMEKTEVQPGENTVSITINLGYELN